MRLRRRWLDYLIARGTSPATSPALTLRARQLVSLKMRERLANSIQRTLRSPDGLRWLRITPQQVCVDAARDELRAIAEMLDSRSLVYARGVAMTAELLQSAESPLFDPREAESAWSWAHRSARALEGNL